MRLPLYAERFDLRGIFNVGFVVLVALVVLWTVRPREFAVEYGVREARAAEAKRMIDAGAVVIDVRETGATKGGRLAGAIAIPLEALRGSLGGLDADRARPIVVYCSDGSTRGPRATALLNQAGYANAVNLKGGFEGWRAAGLPTE